MSDLAYNSVRRLDTIYGTPYYIMCPDVYQNNIMSFISSFSRRYNRIIAGYSFKTNYVPFLCLIAKDCGCFAEVVSEMELELAEELGFTNIIFNGPIKKKKVLKHALDKEYIINLDSEYEVDTVLQYKKEHPEKKVKVGLRINIMLKDEFGNSTIQCGLRTGRFGFPLNRLGKAISRLKSAGVIINSLHGHTSSNDRVPRNYKIISELLLSICEQYNLQDLDFFDVGGGFFGAAAKGLDITNKPSYEDYASVILDTVLNNKWFCRVKPFIIIEPGASVVSNVFNYVTKVHQIKEIGSTSFAIVDGSVFDVKPTMHPYNLPFTIISNSINSKSAVYDVVGSTCMEKDVILKEAMMPCLKRGDYIYLKGVGSYTISLTPNFINYLSPILMLTKSGVKLIRRRQRMEDIISIYNI